MGFLTGEPDPVLYAGVHVPRIPRTITLIDDCQSATPWTKANGNMTITQTLRTAGASGCAPQAPFGTKYLELAINTGQTGTTATYDAHTMLNFAGDGLTLEHGTLLIPIYIDQIAYDLLRNADALTPNPVCGLSFHLFSNVNEGGTLQLSKGVIVPQGVEGVARSAIHVGVGWNWIEVHLGTYTGGTGVKTKCLSMYFAVYHLTACSAANMKFGIGGVQWCPALTGGPYAMLAFDAVYRDALTCAREVARQGLGRVTLHASEYCSDPASPHYLPETYATIAELQDIAQIACIGCYPKYDAAMGGSGNGNWDAGKTKAERLADILRARAWNIENGLGPGLFIGAPGDAIPVGNESIFGTYAATLGPITSPHYGAGGEIYSLIDPRFLSIGVYPTKNRTTCETLLAKGDAPDNGIYIHVFHALASGLGTFAEFQALLASLVAAGYKFITPEDLMAGKVV
jgi:hypothetical protein